MGERVPEAAVRAASEWARGRFAVSDGVVRGLLTQAAPFIRAQALGEMAQFIDNPAFPGLDRHTLSEVVLEIEHRADTERGGTDG